LPKVVRDLGPSVKDRLAATFDAIFDRVKGVVVPSEPRQVHHRETVLSFRAIEDRMYLLHVDSMSSYITESAQHITHCIPGHSTDYVAEHLRSQGFNVMASIWTAGQLYVVADSPRTIAASLPSSHAFAVKRYIRISEWVRVRYGKHKGDIGYVFDSDQSNGLIAILIPPRCFPYPMPSGSVALLDRLRLPNNQTVRDLNRDGKVIGCSYKGEQYYMGLVLKHFHRDRLELVASPHADDIQLHMQSGFDTPFVKKTLAVFSMQFLRIGDSARVISGELRSKIGTVVSTDHASGSVCLEIILDGHRSGIDVRLEDIERVFCVGDEVRVVAGPYLGLEGHIIQISDDMFHVCQDGSKEEVRLCLNEIKMI
jgi:ribosomal protein L24